MDEIKIDEKVVERLKRKIILRESMNLRSREMPDQKMINWIKKNIEEEVQCSCNR